MTADPDWYKDAIVYQLHVKAFADSNNDGCGDFAGLTGKLDYIKDLGATAIWLLPFYPSPLKDDGYDIADYRNVHPAYGTMRDFRKFVREAHKRDLRVVTELVINHTSDQHPWFQRARKAAPGSKWRDYYVWSDTDQKYLETRIIFTDTERSNWAWDPEAQAYYWHRFFSHQPDLNFDNPEVRKAVINAMYYWLDIGVDGLRLDAIPYLVERDGTNNENLPETHAVIRQIRAALDQRYTDRMLLAEANQWPEDVLPYFGDGDECHMAFHFPLMPRVYMALAQEDRHPVTDIMRQTPDPPEGCQWAIFLRNHDELTLEMVTDRERDYMWEFYAHDPRMRINLGIRRRLAPLLDNDRRKMELLNSLLMSFPGTPIIYYGDEIGMGDNIFLGDRDGVRTPMQWSPDRNGGFSRADPAQLYLPPVMDPVYGFDAVNVEAQSRSSSSFLNWMKRLLAVRKEYEAFGRGSLTFLYPGNRKILAYVREWEDQIILCVANLSRSPQPVELNLSHYSRRVPLELLGRSPFPPIGELPYFITLPAYGFYWFLLTKEVEAPEWHVEYPTPEFETVVTPQGLASLSGAKQRRQLENNILRDFLKRQRWFAAKGSDIAGVALADSARLEGPGGPWPLHFYDVDLGGEGHQRYFLPLTIYWERRDFNPFEHHLATAICAVRRGPTPGALCDAATADDFVRGVATAMQEARDLETERGGGVDFRHTTVFAGKSVTAEDTIRHLGVEQTNTSVRLGEDKILKLYRRLNAGIHPEVEIGRYLTDVAEFPNVPALLGTMEYRDADGYVWALGTLQTFVFNQGDGWRVTLNHLERFLEQQERGEHPDETEAVSHDYYMALIRTLGENTAELHNAFAGARDDSAFVPEAIDTPDLEAWREAAHRQADTAFAVLERARASLPEATQTLADHLLNSRQAVADLIDESVPERVTAVKTRTHGDYHLGQVILVQNEFYILDFEGEPTRPFTERRAKTSPWRDVAGMLRSIDYAGWSTLINRGEIDPAAPTPVLPKVVADWRKRTIASFLKGYEGTAKGAAYFPDKATTRKLLRLFVLEKVLYEIAYEAGNRPRWLIIPLKGLEDILAKGDIEHG